MAQEPQYYCYEGNYLCPVNNGTIWQRCNQDCYDPNAYACANGTALVQTGNNTSANVQCGDAWYNPTMYVCDYDGPDSNGTLCPRKPNGETSQACGAACFYPDQYTCDQSTQTLSPTNGNTGAN
uniref:Endo-1,3(4)-beta-glucanase 1 carbohydrate binding domain-containing protein n=1 Tax=Mycena chlorophos TaxID=658473 RepID=A0ABQ0M3R1_MYCCL|nr:predicted protein [Mycena chlorophos]